MKRLSVNNEYIFSVAEDKESGKLVHVDNVQRGSECRCICPCCKEPLIARHGDIREHGFAHHSTKRKDTLRICYMVTLYKMAEQIIEESKKITLPSYYGIFEEKEVTFTNVKIDSRYEREDKQPDVIAQTEEGETYLIEFTFSEKVKHLQKVDYKKMNCIRIDLSNQTLETLKDYLSKPSNWEWVNCDSYFCKIGEKYKNFTIVESSFCKQCQQKTKDCYMKKDEVEKPLIIHNNGIAYRICKNFQQEETLQPQSRSCYQCERNLAWANKNGLTKCGMWQRLNLSERGNNPELAKNCEMYKDKSTRQR